MEPKDLREIKELMDQLAQEEKMVNQDPLDHKEMLENQDQEDLMVIQDQLERKDQLEIRDLEAQLENKEIKDPLDLKDKRV